MNCSTCEVCTDAATGYLRHPCARTDHLHCAGCGHCAGLHSGTVDWPAMHPTFTTATATIDSTFGAGTWKIRLALAQARYDFLRSAPLAPGHTALPGLMLEPPGTPVWNGDLAALARAMWPPEEHAP